MSDSGIVYILKNPSLPDRVKIGFTTRPIEERVSELSQPTGVPEQYEVVATFDFDDCRKAEKDIHCLLSFVRPNKNREFFRMDPDEAKAFVQHFHAMTKVGTIPIGGGSDRQLAEQIDQTVRMTALVTSVQGQESDGRIPKEEIVLAGSMNFRNVRGGEYDKDPDVKPRATTRWILVLVLVSGCLGFWATERFILGRPLDPIGIGGAISDNLDKHRETQNSITIDQFQGPSESLAEEILHRDNIIQDEKIFLKEPFAQERAVDSWLVGDSQEMGFEKLDDALLQETEDTSLVQVVTESESIADSSVLLPNNDGYALAFPDPHLESAVRIQLGLGSASHISHESVQRVITLDLSNAEITSLEGIEIFHRLQNINVDNNQIVDISPLARLSLLQTISADNNQVTDGQHLSGLRYLRSVSLNNNSLDNVEFVIGIPSLSRLYVNGNMIEDIGAICHAERLLLLSAFQNQIIDASVVLSIKSLLVVDLRDNLVESIPIESLRSRQTAIDLDIRGNPVSDHFLAELTEVNLSPEVQLFFNRF